MPSVIAVLASGLVGLFAGGYLSYKYADKLVAKAVAIKKIL